MINTYNNSTQYKDATYVPLAEDLSAMPSSYTNSVDTDNDTAMQLAEICNRLGISNTTVVDKDTEQNIDLMPSATTRELKYNRLYTVQQSVKASAPMTTKTKVMVASYIIVALALIAVIAICAVNVGSQFNQMSLSQTEYSALLAEYGVIQGQADVPTYEEMAQMAGELGYVSVGEGNSQSYQVLETRPAQNYTISTNWFDSLCDWASGVFGG